MKTTQYKSRVAVVFLLLWLPLTFIGAKEPDDNKQEEVIIIRAGSLLDVPGNPPKVKQTLVVVGNEIHSVHDGFPTARQLGVQEKQPQIIDLKEKFVLPGLIDAHVHLMMVPGEDMREPLRTGEESLIVGLVNARNTLEAGITTVADVDAGPKSWSIIVLRDAINDGKVPGSRILAAGSSISPTGGHGDLLDGPDRILQRFASSGLCDGPYECRRAVRRQIRQGADFIKVHATGGGEERTGGKDDYPSFFTDELDAVVATSHKLRAKVTAHAHGTKGINAALRAGVDSIQHGSFLDEESISLFKEKGAYLVPTLIVQDMIADIIDSQPESLQRQLKLFQDEHPANVAKAYKGGVKLAFGTDAGVIPHGNNARELEWLVKIGVNEQEALKIATVNTAMLLGLADEIGALKPGMLADVIAVSGDPLEDIGVLKQVSFVMKDGEIVKSDSWKRN